MPLPLTFSQAMVLGSMAMDLGWKLINRKTQNMTPAELDNFINEKENSIAETEAEIESLYGNP